MIEMLNENIKRLRKEAGLSQSAFAKEMNVSKQCASNWENDNVMPSVEMLVKIADFFRVSTDVLLGREAESSVSVDGLSSSQITHIKQLISDLQKSTEL